MVRDFTPNTYHHIFNRGSFKQKVFRKKKDYDTFIDILKYYLRYPTLSPLSKLSHLKLENAGKTKQQTVKPYKLNAFCLMPNHVHFLLFQQEKSPNLSDFMKKVSITYAMYFQQQYQHSGTLFQGKFKSVKIFDNPQLLYLTKYIHLNPVKITEGSDPSDYPYSSLADYLLLNKTEKDWLDSKTILQKFYPQSPNPQQEYLSFIQDTKETSPDILKSSTLEE
ncbi:MAG: hypothetical protein UV54_C0039G0008 [Candidatus Beckwithbacteria bacterium GW2011_GWA2_43_10]|uniref:Transposase IS200-like domain-containing protein n=1 Tax=Candidatus Beckwithbacteria bacterium GW2011_GWA2_43_10 TaxID=1618369 RepID=A0A0G1C155_9BACT|nr:MAG: hypothetical protein UV54_C0039G0008 [Candidatus Beckwithbacteria bacterium GW2011_GWA2_43_10]